MQQVVAVEGVPCQRQQAFARPQPFMHQCAFGHDVRPVHQLARLADEGRDRRGVQQLEQV
ncbi:hypothetical protein D3C72_2577350 [compost metagenome]